MLGIGGSQAVPSGEAIAINGGAQYTSVRSVTLGLFCDLADEMQIANGDDPTGASWESYASSKAWTLTTTEGLQSVSVRFRALGTQYSEIATAEITYDPDWCFGGFREQLLRDLQDALSTDEMGETVVLEILGESQKSVSAIVSFETLSREDGGRGRQQKQDVTIVFSYSDFPNPQPHDDRVLIDGERYIIEEVQDNDKVSAVTVRAVRMYSRDRSDGMRVK